MDRSVRSHLRFHESHRDTLRNTATREINLRERGSTDKVENMINNICARFNLSSLGNNLERLCHSKNKLDEMLQTYAIGKALGKKSAIRAKKPYMVPLYDILSASENTSAKTFDKDDQEEEIKEEIEEEYEQCEMIVDDPWLGFFQNFYIENEHDTFIINEGKQCIEIVQHLKGQNIMRYLRHHINCFMIDLSKGPDVEQQRFFLDFMSNELKISHELGYSVSSTLFALLTPHFPYTGMLENENQTVTLKKGDKVLVSLNRYYSLRCSSKVIYVNGSFLVQDCKEGDYLLIGPSIQVSIDRIDNDDLLCTVREAGQLRSRLPVRFPSRCNYARISLEEMEDIIFARETGINMIMSYTPASRTYLAELMSCLEVLKCETMRLGTRIVLNDLKSYDENDLPWMAEKYDAFLLDFTWWQREECHDNIPENIEPDILKLSPAAAKFIRTIYDMKKPIILNAKLFAQRILFVHPENVPEIFYYPDRYLISHDYIDSSFYFNFLQGAIFEKLPQFELEPLPYCDDSDVGSDTLARSCVTACYENPNIKGIVLCSMTTDMSVKLSHFRPNIPVICVTSIKSLSNYLGLFHNVTYLYYNTDLQESQSHEEDVFHGLVYGVIHLKLRRLLSNDHEVMLVYSAESGPTSPDRFLAYKYNDSTLATALRQVLFN